MVGCVGCVLRRLDEREWGIHGPKRERAEVGMGLSGNGPKWERVEVGTGRSGNGPKRERA